MTCLLVNRAVSTKSAQTHFPPIRLGIRSDHARSLYPVSHSREACFLFHFCFRTWEQAGEPRSNVGATIDVGRDWRAEQLHAQIVREVVAVSAGEDSSLGPLQDHVILIPPIRFPQIVNSPIDFFICQIRLSHRDALSEGGTHHLLWNSLRNPSLLPTRVLGTYGNRVQHDLTIDLHAAVKESEADVYMGRRPYSPTVQV